MKCTKVDFDLDVSKDHRPCEMALAAPKTHWASTNPWYLYCLQVQYIFSIFFSHILVIMIILQTLLVTFIAVKKICEHFLSRRKFQFKDDTGRGLMRNSSLAYLAVGTKQTWETAMTNGWSITPVLWGWICKYFELWSG